VNVLALSLDQYELIPSWPRRKIQEDILRDSGGYIKIQQDILNNWKLAHFPVKIGFFRGVGGVPEIFFSLESSYFCYLGAHAKV